MLPFVTLKSEIDRHIASAWSAFPALRRETNPVIRILPSLNACQVSFALLEYSQWLNETIHMFTDARIRLSSTALLAEIDENVCEEMGKFTNGVPHLQLMSASFRNELTLNIDEWRASEITLSLIRRVRATFRQSNECGLSGALVAFEAIATEELQIFRQILIRYLDLVGRSLRELPVMQRYLAAHIAHERGAINQEDRHSDRMIEAAISHLGETGFTDLNDFIRGFTFVCQALSTWWIHLAAETEAEPVLAQIDQQHTPSIHPF